MSEPMDDKRLAAILAAEEKNAVGYNNSDIANDQEVALDRFYGEPLGNEKEGHSKVVTREVMEVIESVMPSLMRIFVGNDEAVVFEATNPEEDEIVEYATAEVNYRFYQENDGFDLVLDWLKDALLQKLGVVKVWWDDTPEMERQTFDGLSEDQVVMLEGVEIIEHEEDNGIHTVTILSEKLGGKLCIANIPPEEFLVSRRSKSLDEADYLGHRTQKTASDLLEMGYSEKDLADLAQHAESDVLDERKRNRYEDEAYTNDDDELDESMRLYWVIEEYVKIDYDGDGVAELRQITRVNTKILENEEVDSHPFVSFCPIPMPHKLYGLSLADQAMDLQVVNTTILRQILDNIYLSNNPRMEVAQSGMTKDTLDMLLQNVPGGIIETKIPGQVNPLAVPFVAGPGFQMLEYMTGQVERRTGVTRYNQGLDADSLNKTATGVGLIQEAGQDRVELIARIFANSLGKLFRKALKLIVDNGEPVARKISGQWEQIDPSQWPSDMKVKVNVGLGTGRKDRRLQYRMQLLGLQQQALEVGGVSPEHLYNNVEGIVKDMGLGSVTEYFTSPDEMQQQPPKPDPKLAEAQAKAQADMQKMQMDGQLKREQMERDFALKEQQMNKEFELKQAQMMAEVQLKREAMSMQASVNPDISSGVHFGGEPG